jgi:hypothetical protein
LAEEAPIVVHFKPEDILAKLLKDGVYRNLFETGTSNGNPNMFARAMWEWVVFHGAYHDTAPQDRPKYGVLNTMKDPRGVFSCTGIYGKAYLVLKNTPEIRSRVTFSDRDTSNKGNVCVDCDWKHVMLLMLNMDTIDLDQVVEVAWGRKEHGSSFFNFYFKKLCLHPFVGYNEVQIYGPLRLSCDIEKIVLDESYKEEMTGLLEEIKQQYGIPYEWQRFQLTQEEEIYKTVTLLLNWFRGKMWRDGVIFWSWLQVLKAFSFSLTGTM